MQRKCPVVTGTATRKPALLSVYIEEVSRNRVISLDEKDNFAAAGKITLVTVANTAGLDGGADNRFQATATSGAVSPAPRTTLLASGVLETSNVDMGQAMTDMMDAQRSFELASKAIQMSDQVQEIANGIKR